MPGIWHSRHRRIRCWLVCMPALDPGRKPVAELAHWPPAQGTAWRFRRVRKAASGDSQLLVAWGGQAALHTWPPPKDGTVSRVGDGRHTPTRGPQHPLAPQGRTSAPQPWVFGRRLGLVMANWDGARCPGALRLLRPQTPPADWTAKALGRALGSRLVPPAWATRVLVAGDAAAGSHEPRPMVRKRETDAPARRWGVVWAMARPGKTVEEKAIPALVTHWSRLYAQRIRGPRLPGTPGGKTFWVSRTRRWRRHVGDVTVGRREKGRHVGPHHTTILGTHRDEWSPRQVGGASQRRWPVEIMNWELKSGLGLGEHQVSGDPNRSEKSVGIAVLAYLFVLHVCHHEMVPGKPWSIFQLQHALRLRVMTNQVEHKVKVRMAKTRKAA
jgi:hypothetical protein